MAAWCTLVTRAKLPGGTPSTLSRPSMTYSSHSGRSRSSGRETSRATWMHSWRQSPGCRQGDVADVELEVEVRILDPVRVVEVERHPHEPLAEHAGLVQPLVDVLEDALERHRPAGRGGRVVDRDPAARHVRPRRLGVEERSIHPCELLHGDHSPKRRGTGTAGIAAAAVFPIARAFLNGFARDLLVAIVSQLR